MLAKITSKNQLTLPEAVTNAIGPADYLDVEARDGQIVGLVLVCTRQIYHENYRTLAKVGFAVVNARSGSRELRRAPTLKSRSCFFSQRRQCSGNGHWPRIDVGRMPAITCRSRQPHNFVGKVNPTSAECRHYGEQISTFTVPSQP
jgi:hypothetical protein